RDMDHHVSQRPTDPLARELMRYAVVGGLASLVDVGLLVGLTSGGGVYYLHAASIAFGCGLLTSYLLSIAWVFQVGRIRARYLTARLPNPPVRPVRETFASYGSRQRDIMGKVHFASSTVHSPWTALRVRWVPVYCFPTLSLRAFALCAVFPHSDYYALFDCLEGLGVSSGFPPGASRPSLPSLAGSPVFTGEDSSRML